MLIKCALALLLLSVLGESVGTDNVDVHESHPEKPASQKGRLSLQNTGKRKQVSRSCDRAPDWVLRGQNAISAQNRPMHISFSEYAGRRYLVNTEHT